MDPFAPPSVSVDALRNLALAVPLGAVAITAWVQYSRDSLRGRVPGAFLATLWAWVALLAVEQVQPWWTFAPAPSTALGVPVEVALGWALLWGALPALVGGPWWIWLLTLGWVDVLLMPALEPLVVLGDGWLLGELVLLSCGAAPALLLAHHTRRRTALRLRVLLQAVLTIGLTGWLVPHVVFTHDGRAWTDVVDHPYPVRALLLAVLVTCAAPALAAVGELADAGGTPFPWDPPHRLATSGPYAYVANPMQISTLTLFLVLALAAGSPTLGAVALTTTLFFVVVAERQERSTIGRRWPAYTEYRQHVHAWRPRLRPYVPTPRQLWVSRDCTLCAATGAALEELTPTGLEICAAEDAATPLRRMTWHGDGVTSQGVAAFARALEQTTLLWAWLGWCMRLPVLAQVLQLVADACGLGPRDLTASGTAPADSTARGDR